MRGKVLTYESHKNFGFLKGEDGERYFFHEDDWLLESLPASGIIVNFQAKKEKKGLKAIGIKEVVEKNTGVQSNKKSVGYKSYKEPKSFLFIKDEKPRYGEVIYQSGELVFESSKSPDEAKRILKNKILEAGGNGIVNFRYEKRTGSSGNYRYSIHQFHGSPVYLLETTKLKNKEDIKDKDYFKEQAALFEEKSKLLVSQIEHSSFAGLAMVLFTLCIVILVLNMF